MNDTLRIAAALVLAVGLSVPVAADEAFKAAAQDKEITTAVRELAQTMYEWSFDAAIEAVETCSGVVAADEQACIKGAWLENLFSTGYVPAAAEHALLDAVARYGSRMRIVKAAENERAHEAAGEALIDAVARYWPRMLNETCGGR